MMVSLRILKVRGDSTISSNPTAIAYCSIFVLMNAEHATKYGQNTC